MKQVNSFTIIETRDNDIEQVSSYPVMVEEKEADVYDIAKTHFRQIIQNHIDDHKEWESDIVKDWQGTYPEIETIDDVVEKAIETGFFSIDDDTYKLVYSYTFIL